MTHISPIPPALPSRCPSRRIGLELPLATIEELDLLAGLNHISREQILRQIIKAALISDTPHWPVGPDPIGRLAEHAYLTRQRSYELAATRRSAAASTEPAPGSGAGSNCR